MKHKKLMAAIATLTMCATLTGSLAACNTDNGGDDHTHRYGEWTITTEPGCETSGVRERYCLDCDHKETETVNPTGHDYKGNWKITKYPTLKEDGSAVDTCLNDGSHTTTVVLPKLSEEDKYADFDVVDNIVYDTYNLVFAHENGDIEFSVDGPVETGKTLSVGDAVTVSTDSKFTDLIGSLNGTYTSGIVGRDGVWSETNYDMIFERDGNGYVHVKDGADDNEFWLEKNGDDEIVGVQKLGSGSSLQLFNTEYSHYYNGLAFSLRGINIDASEMVGAEGLLKALYDFGISEVGTETGGYVYDYDRNLVVDSEDTADGVKYSFSFIDYRHGITSTERGGKIVDQYNDVITDVSVSFILNEDYSIKSVSASTKNYAFDSYYDDDVLVTEMPATPEEGVSYVVVPWVKDDVSKKFVKGESATPTSSATLVLDQKAYADMDAMPENPYDLDEIQATSFSTWNKVEVTKAVYDATEVVEGSVRKDTEEEGEGEDARTRYYVYTKFDNEVTTTTSLAAFVVLDDFTPDKASEFPSLNAVSAYLIEGSDETLIYKQGQWIYGQKISAAYMPDEHKFTLRGKQAGDYTVKLVAGNAEKTITLKIEAALPAEIAPMVYKYDAINDGYTENNTTTATVYAGKTLNFSAYAGAPEGDDYEVDSRFTVSLADGTENATLGDAQLGEVDVKTFVATAPGEYTVNFVSDADANLTASLTVTVLETPDVTALLSGSYKNGDVSVAFTPASEGALNGSLTITDSVGSVTYDYAYATDGGLTLTNKSAESTTMKYELSLLDDYSMLLVATDSHEDVSRLPLKAVNANLTAEDALEGTEWSLTYGGKTYTYTFSGNTVSAFCPANGTEDFSFTLTPDGSVDGKYNITFEGSGWSNGIDTEYGSNEGSYVMFDGEKITVFHLNLVIENPVGGYDMVNPAATDLAGTTWLYENPANGNFTVIFNEDNATFTIQNQLQPEASTFGYKIMGSTSGRYTLALTMISDTSGGYNGIYLPDSASGNYIEISNGEVTNLVLNLAGAWLSSEQFVKQA